jgi:hypothetical protein
MGDTEFSGSELARWLQEAGRRRATRPQGTVEVEPAPAAPAAEARRPPSPYLRPLLLLLVAALAWIPYFYAEVQTTIYSLRSLIVFVFFPGVS